MSDLFIGEILVLLLLIPVLLRPFSRRLQRVGGIPLLPPIAFILCALIIMGSGFRISFLPIFLVTILAFVFGLIRLARLFLGLPTDWYKPLSVVWHAFLLALFAGAVVLVFVFAPETGAVSAPAVGRSTSVETESPGLKARYSVWKTAPGATQGPAGKPVMIVLGDIGSGSRGRTSTALEIAGSGYVVLGADFSGIREYRNPLMGSPSARQCMALTGEVLAGRPFLTDSAEVAANQENELSLLVRYARANYGPSTPIYALAEGSAVDALFSYLRKYPKTFAGAVAIVNSKEDSTLPPLSGADSLPGGYAVLEGIDAMMPASASAFPVLVISGPDRGLYGLGELSSDDVLAARLLGSSRDAGRKAAVLTGRRIVSWLSDRRGHDQSGS
jgi:hypothetical protein